VKTYRPDWSSTDEELLVAFITLCEDPDTIFPLVIIQYDGYPLEFQERSHLDAYITGYAVATDVSAKA